MPGVFGEDAHAHAGFRIGAGVKVLREQLASARMVDEIAEQRLEMLGRHRVVAFPPDRVLGGRVTDDRFVFRAASGVGGGLGDERAALGDDRLVAADRFGVELRRVMVPVQSGEIAEAERLRAISGVEDASLPHFRLAIA